ncbi:hypothetical protein Leryth_015639 [Lithospermum erythrorhizon]|nr:hypothetical protein Leryth_015639 [Lithospermum erythrorhizon]
MDESSLQKRQQISYFKNSPNTFEILGLSPFGLNRVSHQKAIGPTRKNMCCPSGGSFNLSHVDASQTCLQLIFQVLKFLDTQTGKLFAHHFPEILVTTHNNDLTTLIPSSCYCSSFNNCSDHLICTINPS